jgi:cysteinyl-tRNA synthetase
MEWDSPWGKGFPGWHLECSVMAREILGDEIDIHTGGIDHIPVHHTNEIAQTEAITGKPFSQFWIHANHIKVDGKKMSKSLGNIVTLEEITNNHYSLEAFKLLVLSKHYRTEGNFTWDILKAAQNRLNRWRAIAVLRHQINDTLINDDKKDTAHAINGIILAAPHAALEKLQEDLNSPEAFAVIEAVFDRIESTHPRKLQKASLVSLLEWIRDTLGIDLLTSTPDIPDSAKQAILERRQAREQNDWSQSDHIRNIVQQEYGITLLDSAEYTLWQYKS